MGGLWVVFLSALLLSGTAYSAGNTLQNQPNRVCSFLGGRVPPGQPPCRSTVKCLIDELGWPTTAPEMFIAYLAAVHEYCTALSGGPLSDASQCDIVPFCSALLPDADGYPFVEVQVDDELVKATTEWYGVVAQSGKSPTYLCRPDWFTVLVQPVNGSPHAQMQHCFQNRSTSQDRTGCPTGCGKQKLVLVDGLCNTADCWPPFVLKRLCNSTVKNNLTTFVQQSAGLCPVGLCPSLNQHCRGKTAAACRRGCVHEACAVASQLVREQSWSFFRGECQHTAAVDRLLASAPRLFVGDGCSVLGWVDNSTGDLWQLQSKVCAGTYPRPAFITPLLSKQGAVGKVWLASVGDGDIARPPPAVFASALQAALVQCPTGYDTMHPALSQPWLSHQLLEAVLPPDSAWRAKLLQGAPLCGNTTSSNDVCVRPPRGAADVEEAYDAAHPPEDNLRLVSNTSLVVLKAYCRAAFTPAAATASEWQSDAAVNASCDKIAKDTGQIRQQHAPLRKGLAAIWITYLVALVVGFSTLLVYWRFCGSGGRRRDTWFAVAVKRVCGLFCPAPIVYHPGIAQTTMFGQAQGAARGGWRAVLVKRAVSASHALAYCADVGLDIWTLVEVRRNADSFATQARAYSGSGDYNTQLNWRAGHSDMLFWWLIIVFVVQYAAGILLTLPPTLAAYGVFNYQRLQFSCGCCTLVFFSGACGIFVGIFSLVGLWYIVVADVYMLLAMFGVPAKLLQGNRLNLPAYTTLRYMCEGILEALPSALISTAAINQQLLSQQIDKQQLAVFWMSLLFSMFRVARELYKLAQLTHDLGASCFFTAILDTVYHVQPQQAGAAAAQGQQQGGAAAAQGKAAVGVGSAPDASSSTMAPASGGFAVTAPQQETGMTRDSTGLRPGQCTASTAAVPAAVAGQQQGVLTPGSGDEDAAAAAGMGAGSDVRVTGPDSSRAGAGAGVSATTGSKQDCSCCCWHRAGCESSTEYPPVLAVYVYCCLAVIAAYLLLVCSDIVYPWLIAARTDAQQVCTSSAGESCRYVSYYIPPPFQQQYNLLALFLPVPELSNSTSDCVLPSLTCA